MFNIYSTFGSDALLLVELGSLCTYTSEEKSALCRLMPFASWIQTVHVLSLSSGSFEIESGHFGRLLSNIEVVFNKITTFSPFTREVHCFKGLHDVGAYPLKDDYYKGLTKFFC